jgi:hypothetical protein
MAMTLDEIRQAGLEALRERLGPVGAVRFLQQFQTGQGDYAAERQAWVDRTKLQEIRAAARRKRSKKK